MPTRESAPHGAPCWIELSTPDPAASNAFYGAVFGWTASEPAAEFGGYYQYFSNGVPIAGVMQTQPGAVDGWNVYLSTDDITKTMETVTAGGGQVVVEPMALPELGSMAFAVDAGGAGVGFWQAAPFAGIGVLGEADAPAWFELHTRDFAKCIDFYREITGLTAQSLSDTDEFRYSSFVSGQEMHFGVADDARTMAADESPRWHLYIGAHGDDTDATVAKIEELGGTVLMAAEDTPYGRIAAVADPQGVRFLVVAPNDQMPAKS